MKPTDDERLRHLLDAVREACDLLADSASAELTEERKLALALVKLIEIAGEAASHVSPARRAQFPRIPWEQLVATRNRLIHGYYDINTKIVLQTVREDFPLLIRELEPILGKR